MYDRKYDKNGRQQDPDQFTYPWGWEWQSGGLLDRRFRLRGRAPYKRRKLKRAQLKILNAVITGRPVNHIPNQERLF